jgi:hypothetical protein
MTAHRPRPAVTPYRLVKPCGCDVYTEPGHVHTWLCEGHRRELFKPRGQIEPDNLDLVGG